MFFGFVTPLMDGYRRRILFSYYTKSTLLHDVDEITRPRPSLLLPLPIAQGSFASIHSNSGCHCCFIIQLGIRNYYNFDTGRNF